MLGLPASASRFGGLCLHALQLTFQRIELSRRSTQDALGRCDEYRVGQQQPERHGGEAEQAALAISQA